MLPVGNRLVVAVISKGAVADALAGRITGSLCGVVEVGIIGSLDGGAVEATTGVDIKTKLGLLGVCSTGGDGITVCRTC